MLPDGYDDLFRLIYDHIHDIVFVIDVDMDGLFRFAWVNQRFLEATGLQIDQVAGQRIEDVIPEPAHALVLGKYRQAIEEKGAVHWLETSVYPAGVKTGEVTVVPVFGDRGRCAQLVGTVHDVSEHVEAKRKLERMGRMYAALSECNQAIVRCTSELELLAKVCRIAVEHGGMKMAWIGREDDDHRVRPVACFGAGTAYLDEIEITTDADSVHGNGPVGTAMRTRQPVWCHNFQHHAGLEPWHAAGARFGWGAVASLPLFCKGRISGTLNMYATETHAFDEPMQRLLLELAEDISYALGRFLDDSERSQEQAELHMLSEAMNQSPAVIIMTDLGGTIEYVNPAFSIRYGYAAAEVVGQSIRLLQPGPSNGVVFDDIEQGLKREGKWAGELVNTAKNGREIIESSTVTILRAPDGEPIQHVYALRNVTEQKQSEQERQQLQAQLQHMQKMDSVGRLAGGIAHDFNNMLGVIIAYAELALRHASDARPLASYLQEIHKAANRSADLTRQLLTLARRQTHTPKAIDVNATVDGTLNMLRRLIGEHITLDWLPEADPWPVYIDPSQFDQVLANLCVNARDAIGDRGRIAIKIRNESLDADYCLHHPEATPGDYLRLSVSDSGCGIARADLERIFEPFFTTKSLGEGTGLGLSTVYGIVEQNKGFIHVYSEPGHGSTFHIYLPRHGGTPTQASSPMRGSSFARGHEQVLLVEDEAAILDVARSVLENCGYAVLAAQSPQEAMRISEAHEAVIDILITDMIMPDMNGRALAERLVSQRPGMRCLYMSGYSDDIIAHEGILEEGIHFIQKPFSMAGLAAKVREVLDA